MNDESAQHNNNNNNNSSENGLNTSTQTTHDMTMGDTATSETPVMTAQYSTDKVNASTPASITSQQARRLPRNKTFAVLNAALEMKCEGWLASHGLDPRATLKAIEESKSLPVGGATGTRSDAMEAAVILKNLGIGRCYRCVAVEDLENVLEFGLRSDTSAFSLKHSKLVTHKMIRDAKESFLRTGEMDLLPETFHGWLQSENAHERLDATLESSLFQNEVADSAESCLVFLSMEAAFDYFQASSPAAMEQRYNHHHHRSGRRPVTPGVMVIFDVVSALAIQHQDVDRSQATVASKENRDRVDKLIAETSPPPKFTAIEKRTSSSNNNGVAAIQNSNSPAAKEWGYASVDGQADCYISRDAQQCAVADHKQLVPRFVVRL